MLENDTENYFMQFLIFSDSHGRPEKLKEALSRTHRCDGVFFLGDGVKDLAYCDIECLYAVSGNCDYFSFDRDEFPDKRVVTVGGKRILMTHGHKYGVKSGLGSLIYAAIEEDADIVLFGHTHERLDMRVTQDTVPSLKKPVYFFNPGSIGDFPGSWGCLDITLRGEVLFSHGEL